MREKDDVAREARESGEEIHFARAHTIMVEKHHILEAQNQGQGGMSGEPND